MLKYLQRLGLSLIVPVAIMPAAAILIGVGYWINTTGHSATAIATFLINAGRAITNNLPLLFAVGISYGMTKEKGGAAAISGVVSFLIITTILSNESVATLQGITIEQVDPAFNNINNAFVGILSGLVAATCFEIFSKVHLPKALSFFSGKRLVPIVSSVIMIFISLIFYFVWPFLYNTLIVFGESLTGLGPAGAGIYAFYNRLLIPTGLHHALNSVFWFDVAGINDIGKFWGEVEGGVLGVTGMYQAGFFPIMMFGLPGAALAMYRCARTENKKKIASLMLAVGFSSFFTGITEPLEFLFMFTAPLLYFVHAIFTGIVVFVAASFQWMAGFSFSAGLVDYVLGCQTPFANNIFMLIPLGVICGIVYYNVFKFLILKFNLMTPGREKETLDNINYSNANDDFDMLLLNRDLKKDARTLYESVGKETNIITVESCITRLRLELKDLNLVNESLIKNLDIGGIVYMGEHNIQIIIGVDVQFVVDEIEKLIKYDRTKEHENN